jgi:hypothetical protein
MSFPLPAPVGFRPNDGGASRLIGAVPSEVTDALTAANAHDVPGFVSCFRPKASLDAWGMLFEGGSEIARWSDRWVVAYQVRFTDFLHAWEGLAVAVHAQVHGHGYNGPATLTFHTSDGSIDYLRISN